MLDRSEGNLHQIKLELSRMPSVGVCSAILGDVADSALLAEIFENEKPEIVMHTAACKHVPLMESNVIEAVRNNALGTNQLAKMAAACRVESLVMVSTDKAVSPQSVMGATKRVAELALLRWSSPSSSMRAVRLGNVLGSQGSVVPTFLQQIAAGGPVTVTHPDATRYFFTMEEAVELVLLTANFAGETGIFIPDPGDPVRILDLAQRLIREVGDARDIPIVLTGLRPGDKLNEEFVSTNETVTQIQDAQLRRVSTLEPPHSEFDAAIESLHKAVENRDVASAIETLCRLVPEYRPSPTALEARCKQESSSR